MLAEAGLIISGAAELLVSNMYTTLASIGCYDLHTKNMPGSEVGTFADLRRQLHTWNPSSVKGLALTLQ